MTDSDELDEKHERNREQRERAVERWVEYIETHDVAVWGPQQNRLVDSQLESARQSDIDIEHRRRVARSRLDETEE
ncbi:hypothetical protein BRD20_01555 [Halobacteriales archaeon SW_8_65_20]|nr:MAG: hypothetical protein BRC71_04700 [Halobacteriales archaeon QH_7_65_31]PSQ31219.1 MAG: hypothetical protein BRD16_03580 [Halobacteriales archaeon SW_6_65_46]PSQ53799.1 MAG: hypothetical protein BRD20_01555 [Halobacteriales archaeon SW_8_65_20]